MVHGFVSEEESDLDDDESEDDESEDGEAADQLLECLARIGPAREDDLVVAWLDADPEMLKHTRARH